MQNADILALANLRVDGREHSQLREVKCKLNISLNADGSVYFEQGLNKVLVNVHGPMEPQRRVDSSIDRVCDSIFEIYMIHLSQNRSL